MVGAVLATCIIAATALTLTYEVTRERILEQERAAERAALQTVLPDATEFDPVEELMGPAAEAAEGVSVEGLYRSTAPDGELLGWGVRVAPQGYAGPVSMVVGLDRDGTVLGASIITMRETPGLGTKIRTEPGFLEQFEGWDGTDIEAAAREFDAIVGATVSSVAVREGVVAAGRIYDDLLATEGGEGMTP